MAIHTTDLLGESDSSGYDQIASGRSLITVRDVYSALKLDGDSFVARIAAVSKPLRFSVQDCCSRVSRSVGEKGVFAKDGDEMVRRFARLRNLDFDYTVRWVCQRFKLDVARLTDDSQLHSLDASKFESSSLAIPHVPGPGKFA